MKPKLQFWYEFASTYSFLAALRIEELAKAADVEVLWKPFLLGPVFRKYGLSTSPFILNDDKNAYMRADIGRIADDRGLKFQVPESFPVNALLAARVALSGADKSWGPAFTRAVYIAEFSDGLDISNQDIISNLLVKLELDPQEVFAKAFEQSNKDALKTQTNDAMDLGLFGAPFFVTEKGTQFWGDDRLEQALTYATKGR